MENIVIIIFFAFEVIIGLASTLYLGLSLFVVLGQKIYRKCKYGCVYVEQNDAECVRRFLLDL